MGKLSFRLGLDDDDDKKSGASATFTIDRAEFGMTYSRGLDAGGLNIGHEVKLAIDLELDEVKK